MNEEYIIDEVSYQMLAYKVSKFVDIENLREVFKIFEQHKEREMKEITPSSSS